jgi:hypothetical protein
MTGSFAAFGHERGARRVEKHYSFCGKRAGLGCAE